MITHRQIWTAIDLVARRKGWSLSHLASSAGLDSTVLNPCKRFSREGKPRWPSTQTLALLLGGASMSLSEFCALAEGHSAEPEEADHADILLVDDEPEIREGYAAVLRATGYRVRVAASHHDVLGLIDRKTRFDLLCTDVVMPESMGGVALARLARDHLPDLKVMYISGFDIPSLAGQPDLCLLRKPIAAETLVERVRGLLAA